MLKFVFWFLLAVNVIVFASTVEYSGISKIPAESRAYEPVEDGRIRILSSSRNASPVPPVEEKKKGLSETACIELENFNTQDADLFAKKMALPANKISRTHTVKASGYMVYIPPFKNIKTAEKRIAELQEKGITNYFLIPEGTRFRHAISLGLFKTEKSARNLMEELEKRSIHDARITARGKTTESVSFKLNNLSSNQIDRLNTLLAAFPQVTRKECGVATEIVQ